MIIVLSLNVVLLFWLSPQTPSSATATCSKVGGLKCFAVLGFGRHIPVLRKPLVTSRVSICAACGLCGVSCVQPTANFLNNSLPRWHPLEFPLSLSHLSHLLITFAIAATRLDSQESGGIGCLARSCDSFSVRAAAPAAACEPAITERGPAQKKQETSTSLDVLRECWVPGCDAPTLTGQDASDQGPVLGLSVSSAGLVGQALVRVSMSLESGDHQQLSRRLF